MTTVTKSRFTKSRFRLTTKTVCSAKPRHGSSELLRRRRIQPHETADLYPHFLRGWRPMPGAVGGPRRRQLEPGYLELRGHHAADQQPSAADSADPGYAGPLGEH